jgi:hypothetical protein
VRARAPPPCVSLTPFFVAHAHARTPPPPPQTPGRAGAARAGTASLHVAATNAAALALYAAVGFERDALLVDYYGRGRDAVRMRVDDVRARAQGEAAAAAAAFAAVAGQRPEPATVDIQASMSCANAPGGSNARQEGVGQLF